MKKIFAIVVGLVLASSAIGAEVGIVRNELGSGTPGSGGFERAMIWENDIVHAPQYLPYYPTAATIWPRVLELKCTKSGAVLKCPGYNWSPEMGRAEYLFVKPVVVEDPQPVVITNTVIKEVPVIKEVIVLKEVPIKKKRE